MNKQNKSSAHLFERMHGKARVKLVFKLHHDRQKIFRYWYRSGENGCTGQTKGFISLFMIR